MFRLCCPLRNNLGLIAVFKTSNAQTAKQNVSILSAIKISDSSRVYLTLVAQRPNCEPFVHGRWNYWISASTNCSLNCGYEILNRMVDPQRASRDSAVSTPGIVLDSQFFRKFWYA